jgi:hypothetical protein
LPLALVIFYRKSDVSIAHADNAVITDGNPMWVLPKIINYRLCAIKNLLTMRNPFRILPGTNPFFGRRMVTVFFSSTMKPKLIRIPETFPMNLCQYIGYKSIMIRNADTNIQKVKQQ